MNWRVKSEDERGVLQANYNNGASHQDQPRSWTRSELPNAASTQKDSSPRTSDPTSSAFTERRRLYVGNMPYMAKRADVEALFTGGDYIYNM